MHFLSLLLQKIKWLKIREKWVTSDFSLLEAIGNWMTAIVHLRLGGIAVKNPPANAGHMVQSMGWEDPLEKVMVTLVHLPGESHGRRSLEGYSPRGHKSRADWAANTFTITFRSFQVVLVVRDPPASAGNVRDRGSIPGPERFLWRRAQQRTPAFLHGESRGQRSLAGYSL